jgi:O-antigen biosynthesis alpha-1,3-mannosyltransferase
MRIAYDAFSFGSRSRGGNSTYTIELIKALAGLHALDELLLVSYWNRKKRVKRLIEGCPNCVVCNLFPQPKLLGNRLKPFVTAANPLLELLLKTRCDLFHCTNPMNFPFRLSRVATTIHDCIGLKDDPWATPANKAFFHKHFEEILRRSSHIFVNSNCTSSDIIDRFRFTEGKITVTPLAAHPRFAIVPKDRGFLLRYGIGDTGRPYLLAVGEIQHRKNQAGLIAAFETLPDRYRDLRLFIVGKANNRLLSEDIFTAINASPVRDRIVVLQDVTDEDLVLFYNHAEALAYVSFFEGFGLPLIEAMQCGCPVVASNTSAMREIAEGAALMVNPYDRDSISHGITRLLDSPSLQSDLRDKGRTRASLYSWRRTAELTLEGYKKIPL